MFFITSNRRITLGLVVVLFVTRLFPLVTAAMRIPTPADFLVQGLEDIEPAYSTFQGQMYAGLISTRPFTGNEKEDADEQLMYRLFVPDQPQAEDALVIWLNGGPGCSSFGGGMAENQPVTIPSAPAGFIGIPVSSKLQENPYAWTKTATTLYVEHPAGTGFSHGTIPADETAASRDFYHFLQNLYKVFEQDAVNNLRAKRLFIFGESYAGMYVPSIANYILTENHKNNNPSIHLAGIGLGNGWIDARVQGPAVIDYAWWHGMIDSNTRQALHNEWLNCKDGATHQPAPFHTFTTPDECGIMPAVLIAAGLGAVSWGEPNGYDHTTWDGYGYLLSPNSTVATFYNNPLVQDALHVPRQFWYECLPGAGRRRRLDDESNLLPGEAMLRHDTPVSVVPYIANLLDNHVRVLIYAGDRDVTTNAQGSEMLLDQMEWSGASGWHDTSRYQRGLWMPLYQQVSGYSKEYKNLQFLIVVNSGHLVPFNVPETALDLITRFVDNRSFIDQVLPTFHIDAPSSKTNRAGYGINTGGFSLVGLFLSACLGLVAGILVSKYFPRFISRKEEGYQMVPNVDSTTV